MHAYIIYGSQPGAIEEKVKTLLAQWHVSHFDTIIIEKEEEKKDISILQIREMTKQLSLTPRNGPFIVSIIKDAHLMTIPAQNAILKILEEPPPKVKFILTTNAPDSLLQTIISRCERVSVSSSSTPEDLQTLTLESLFRFETMSVSQILSEIDTMAGTNQDALSFVDRALQVLHIALLGNTTSPYGPVKCAELAEILLKTRMQLSVNVNQKLALDNGFLDAFHKLDKANVGSVQ